MSRFPALSTVLLACALISADRAGAQCSSPIGVFGDATGDGSVNIIDAQQIARFSVGLSIANTTAMGIGGDVDGSGAIDIIDAQQIARFSVGLSLGPFAAARIQQPVCPVPQASLSQSIIGASASSVASGQTVTLSLAARNGSGAALTSGGLLVVFTKGGGTSDGTISGTTDNGNGTYTATFTAVTPGTPLTIGATIDGSAVTSTPPSITVVVGAASIVWSTVGASPSSVPTGGTVALTLAARDGNANPLTTGGLAVAFTKGAGTSDGIISATTDNGNGSYSATFTATTAGTPRTIGATISGAAVTSGLPTVTVTPGAASVSQSAVSVSSGSVVSGAGITLTLTARDAGGVGLTTGGLSVGFTEGAGTSDGTISATTDHGNGTYTATFTGTTAGSARMIGATIGGSAVTSALPAVTVTPGAVSLSQSAVSVSAGSVGIGGTATLTLTTRDAAGNFRTTGGLSVAFSKSGGTSGGSISGTTDNGNGSYTATFTGAAPAGTALTIGATIGGSAVTSTLPTITVTLPAMALGTDSVTINVQIGTVSSPQQVSVASDAGGAIGGLSTTVTSLTGSPALCTSVSWFATPTFDMGGIANPVSLMTLTADATSLPLGTCVRQVTVNSTTAGVASKSLVVVLNVGRAPAAEGVIDVVMMGNAGGSQNIPQAILPTPTIELANGGRGTITNLAATVTATAGYRDCPEFPDDPSVCHAWLRNSDLSFSSPQMPSVLSIASLINPFGGSATVQVTGTGMSPLTFNITVNFNTQGELVTNPRGIVMRGVAKGALVLDSVMAFNQNSANQPLTNIRLDSTNVFPAWLTVAQSHPFTDSLRVKLTANPTVSVANTPGLLLTYNLKLIADWHDPFAGSDLVEKLYSMPITFVVEGGLSFSLPDATLFGVFNGASATQDIRVNNNGSGERTGLAVSVAGGAPWLSASFVGGVTTTPATLRLTASPTGMAKGTYNTTVTVTSGSGVTLQTRVVPVHFIVF